MRTLSHWCNKSLLVCLTLVAALCAAPSISYAGDVAVHGSMWDGKDDPGWGAGLKVGVPVHKMFEVELRGTWIEEMTPHKLDGGVEMDAVPVEAGLSWNFLPEDMINPYISGGANFVFVDSSVGDANNEWGWYAGGGLEIGPPEGLAGMVEVLYRDVDGDLDLGETDVRYDLGGVAANVGLLYRW